MNTVPNFFERLMPHGMCYAWKPEILWLHVFSDAAVTLAYFMIPILLYHFTRRRIDLPFRPVLMMFVVFIVACGLTHAMSIWTVWNGHYGLQGLLKLITALASIGTALMLIPVTPKLLAMRSPQELEAANDALKVEINTREATEAQSQRLVQELAHADRVTTMGQMAAGLAHELNQPLTTITQNADSIQTLTQRGTTVDPMVIKLVDHIAKEAHRAGDIIKALRGLVSKEGFERSAVDIDALVDQVVQLSSPQARDNNVTLKVDSRADVEVSANRAQLAQVLVNLIRNAVDAIVHSKSVLREVGVKAMKVEGAVKVTVSDTGPGFDQDLKALEPFETTKSQGMGMGLFICKSIIDAHGGDINVGANDTGGASISFTLPMPGSA